MGGGYTHKDKAAFSVLHSDRESDVPGFRLEQQVSLVEDDRRVDVECQFPGGIVEFDRRRVVKPVVSRVLT
jgi:hypothetical protein